MWLNNKILQTIAVKILNYINEGNEEFRILLLTEVEELIAISSKMIINKK